MDMNQEILNNDQSSQGRRQGRKKGRNEGLAILLNVVLIAAMFSTIFVSITPDLFSLDMNAPFSRILSGNSNEAQVDSPAAGPTIVIGIVSGHLGNDPGAVCENGTTEADVNLRIATLVQQRLNALGYQTDLLEEMDPRLAGYKAALLVSIHNDSCAYVNDEATGYKVTRALGSTDENLASRLERCMIARYGSETGLNWHDSITNDMTYYHAFDEIDPSTPSVIIETGFLNMDYDLLVNNTEIVANGVTNGITCFINNESIDTP